jgi:hypothetical protein
MPSSSSNANKYSIRPLENGNAEETNQVQESARQTEVTTGVYGADEGQENEDQENEDQEKLYEKQETDPQERQMPLKTAKDAMKYCKQLIDRQIQSAVDNDAAMNTPIKGDSYARLAVCTLLPDMSIRQLFLETVSLPTAWPRIRPLFGSPPFHFLLPQDADLLRASGMASGRVNMTYSSYSAIASSYQFGAGHLVDESTRQYRVVPSIRQEKNNDDLHYDIQSVSRNTESALICLNVKVKRRNVSGRNSSSAPSSSSSSSSSHSVNGGSVPSATQFPFPGERIVVRYSRSLQRLWGRNDLNETRIALSVQRVIRKSPTAATAALFVKRV